MSLDHPRIVQCIVIHTMESAEREGMARDQAHEFAVTSVAKSAHYCIDGDSIYQCLQTKDIAFAAPPLNTNGIHLEHAGRASQTPLMWSDDFSNNMLANSAKLCGLILCRKYDVPARWLPDHEVSQLLSDRSVKGFCTHNQITQVFRQSTHTDPGPNFPFTRYMELVKAALED